MKKKSELPTLNQLRLLLAVRRAQSLGAAARELGVSQPALSRGARELERRCGFEIFDRGFYNTYLSGAGRNLADHARQVLDEYEKLLEAIAKLGQRRPYRR